MKRVYNKTIKRRKESPRWGVVVDMLLKNGKELNEDNLMELLEEEEILVGGAMKKNIKAGKLEFVAKHFKLQKVEKLPGEEEFFQLIKKLRGLYTRLSILTDDGFNGDIAVGLSMTAEEREAAMVEAEAEKEEANKIRREIEDIEKQATKNEYFRFLGTTVKISDFI